MRKVLLRYFSDTITAVTLLLTALATNLIQYTSADAGQSHVYIFFLYAVVLYASMRWHELPSKKWSLIIGYTIGLATMSRPTEAVMLFIPLLWQYQGTGSKWKLLKEKPQYIVFAVLGGFLGILPQLLYWHAVTGSWIYDVGSKWFFLNPFFRVLVGWEKGWFIYTPVTIFFILGLFFVKSYPFRKSVIWFSLLNIWIIISWSDWRYGGSYSTRALVQSYPVFALALAALLTKIWQRITLVAFVSLLGLYLIIVNIFQYWQYNNGILHYYDMNKAYYSRIYLNPHPTALDMSLLDTQDWLSSENDFEQTTLYIQQENTMVESESDSILLANIPINTNVGKQQWLKITASINAYEDPWGRVLYIKTMGDSTQTTAIRMYSYVGLKQGEYATYVKLAPNTHQVQLGIAPANGFKGTIRSIAVIGFSK